MFTKIFDLFCLCSNQKENPLTINLIQSNQKSENETKNSTFIGKNKKFGSTKTNAVVMRDPIHLKIINDTDSSINSPCNNNLTILKIPEELIRKKIKMFGTSNDTRRRIIDENRYFQNFQNKINDIVNEYNKQKTVSESDDSESN